MLSPVGGAWSQWFWCPSIVIGDMPQRLADIKG